MNHADSKTPAGRRRHRNGAVLAVVLVVLLVALLICGSLLRMATLQRQQVRSQQQRVQTAWLVEAGLERGAAALAADPTYRGEIWEIPAEDLNGSDGGLVEIRVEDTAEPPGRRLRVRAEFPRGDERRAGKTKTIRLDGNPPGGLERPPTIERP